jgi:AAA ATPase domain
VPAAGAEAAGEDSGLATGSELIGRDDELARLRGLVDPPPEHSRVLVLLGDAGMGKSVLLADAAQRARMAGSRSSRSPAGSPSGIWPSPPGGWNQNRSCYCGFDGRTLADNAPEAMLSLVTNMPVPSGLTPSVAKDQRTSTFPYVTPA